MEGNRTYQTLQQGSCGGVKPSPKLQTFAEEEEEEEETREQTLKKT